jgi:hypothetical protein
LILLIDIKRNVYTIELQMTELLDITEQIFPEEEIKFFNDEESLELYQTCIYLMEEFIRDNP